MLIVAGHLQVDPRQRDAYVRRCREVVELARAHPGCLDFAIAADPLDGGRVLVHERWTDEASLLAFRGSGPDAGQRTAILSADVRRFTVHDEGPA